MTSKLIILALCIVALASCCRDVKLNDIAGHIKVHYGDSDTQVIIGFTTLLSYDGESLVSFGTSPDELSVVKKGTNVGFKDKGTHYQSRIHSVVLDELAPGVTYYYRIGKSGNYLSDLKSFTNKIKSIRYAIYGDLGYLNHVSLSQLEKEVQEGSIDSIIHVGDFAYNFDTDRGLVGDNYENSMEKITSSVPYMVVAGNHEHAGNFSQYRLRFHSVKLGVGKMSGSNTNLWYSFDKELVHFLAFDTEALIYYTDDSEIERQFKWMENDLIKANANRDNVPWIISYAHRCSWMPDTKFDVFEELLHKYGVDVHFCGHQHNYDRMYPFYKNMLDPQSKHEYKNPKYLVQIVAGSSGNQEGISPRHGPENLEAYLQMEYGYGHFEIHNKTHAYWDWIKTADERREIESNLNDIQDYVWIIQENHQTRSGDIYATK